ncbi:Voltage-gated potassium channel subunit beta-2-like protein [Aix galericulata]|nr:Voltage-gated potassium channel subunit beta-2-like protein [Aix galericulata]
MGWGRGGGPRVGFWGFGAMGLGSRLTPCGPGLGAVTWSPVAPSPDEELLPHGALPGKGRQVEELQPLAQRLGCSVPQLAIAWCLRAEGVSAVLLGAASPELLREQLRALQVLPLLSPSLLQELQGLLGAA